MATPTEAELFTQLKNIVDVYDETYKFAATAGTNFLGVEDTLTQSLEMDTPNAAEVVAAVAASRARIAAALSDGRRAVEAWLRQYMRFTSINVAVATIDEMLDEVYDRWMTSSDRIQSRVFTFGAVAAGGGNTGTGTVLRLTKDERNFDLQACHPDVKTFECAEDMNTGAAAHEEVFTLQGGAAATDALGQAAAGSGRTARMRAWSARDSLLQNSSFDDFAGTIAAPTDIPGWTSSVAVVGDGTDYTIDQTNFFRAVEGATAGALNIKLTRNLTQKLTVRGTELDPKVPYQLQLAWNRSVGSASGTLVVRMGGVSTSISPAAEAGWQVTRVPTATGQNNWYRQFVEDDLDIAIEWTRTAGNLLIDDLVFAPMQPFDGLWHWIAGGATRFRRLDTFTFTDTVVEAVIQKWLWLWFGRHLPHSGAPTITDP